MPDVLWNFVLEREISITSVDSLYEEYFEEPLNPAYELLRHSGNAESIIRHTSNTEVDWPHLLNLVSADRTIEMADKKRLMEILKEICNRWV